MICGYEILWQEFIDLDYAPLPLVLAGFIGGFLCPTIGRRTDSGMGIGFGGHGDTGLPICMGIHDVGPLI